jgi:hypothetical protein
MDVPNTSQGDSSPLGFQYQNKTNIYTIKHNVYSYYV